jgi:hypothetical protein
MSNGSGSERVDQPCDELADGAQADDTHGAIGQLATDPPRPVAIVHLSVRSRKISQGRQHQQECQLGDALRVGPRCRGHAYAETACGSKVNGVRTGSVATDDAQVARRA